MAKILSKVKYLLLLPMIGLVLLVLAWFVADISAQQALRKERQWESTNTVRSYSEWSKAVQWAQLSIKLNPYQGIYSEMLGRLYIWRFFVADKPIVTFEEANKTVNKGSEYFRDAIEKRPTWPMAWSELLRLKSIGGQIDDEFEQIWDKSIQLGDWEPLLQTTLLEAGLLHWSILTDTLREKTIRVFVELTSKPYSEQRALITVSSARAWPLICDVMVDPILITDGIRSNCQQMREQQQQPPAPPIPLILE